MAPAVVHHPAAAGPDHGAHPDPAGPGLAQAVRPGVPDDGGRLEPVDAVDRRLHLRDRVHRLPVRLRGSDLLRVLRDHHHHLGGAGHHQPAEEGVMTTLVGSDIDAAEPDAEQPRTAPRGSSRRPGEKRFGIGRIVAFAVLALLALGWLLPFLWAVDTAFKTET